MMRLFFDQDQSLNAVLMQPLLHHDSINQLKYQLMQLLLLQVRHPFNFYSIY